MTGFGNASINSEFGKISIDIKSLNSKNLDLNYSLNPMFKNIETDIRSILTTSLKRGKIDFKINFKISDTNFSSNLNYDIIKSYIKDLKKITPGTLTNGAEFLKIAITLPNSIGNSRSDLDQELLENIKVEIDQNRIQQELIYYLEKFDINEEIVRLKNHLIYFKTTLNESQIEKGKKLIFISQEIGREINTIGSKSNNLQMQQAVVEMKNELEKIKEQLLNVL
jgi:uncharacterized protein YicC (UPF0701 family)